jgi:hypothetical protein
LKSPLAPTTVLPRAAGARAAGAPARRARRWALGLGGLVAAAALSGCQVDNTPKTYDEANGIVRQNFVETCTGRIPTASTTVILASDQSCACAFGVFKDRVPYNGDDRARIPGYPQDKPTFQDLEAHLKDDPSKYGDLPDDVQKAVKACNQVGLAGPVAGAATPGTTEGTTPGTAAP